MVSTRSFLFKTLLDQSFKLWLRTCQLSGLFLQTFDKKNDRFCQSKFLTTLCVLASVVTSVGYPIILSWFHQYMITTHEVFAITIFVSILTEVFFYLIMVFSYKQQLLNRQKIYETLNDVVNFYRRFEEIYKEFITEARLTRYQFYLFFGIFIKFTIFLLSALGFLFLFGEKNYKIYFGFLSTTYFVSMIICNQFIFGILFLKHLLTTLNEKLRTIIYQNHTSFDENKLQQDLEDISAAHKKIYGFLGNIISYFGTQIACYLFCNFFNLAVCVFQIFVTFMMLILGFEFDFYSPVLISVGTSSIVLFVCDISLNAWICIGCISEVRLIIN